VEGEQNLDSSPDSEFEVPDETWALGVLFVIFGPVIAL
jgi:hypothetical protein